MNNREFAAKLIDVAKNYKTLYVSGCFGAPLNEKNKARYINNKAHGNYNLRADRKAMIDSASDDTFGFDCVCLIKGILWGWNGDKNKPYGGAIYTSNNVPDINASQMINSCKDLSTDFSKIEIGEAVYLPEHIGVYIGNGLAVECTPKWKNCVQITSCNCSKAGYNRRNWTKHGKLPYITYDTKLESGNDIVWELMNGRYKIEISEVDRAVKAIDKAKNSSEYMSLYWILYKLVNSNE